MYIMKFEGFRNIFKRKTEEEKLEELKEIEYKLEFGSDVYLWSTYVRKLKKYLNNIENIPTFDIGNSIRLFNIVRNRQKLLPSDVSDFHEMIRRNYNR